MNYAIPLLYECFVQLSDSVVELASIFLEEPLAINLQTRTGSFEASNVVWVHCDSFPVKF